MIREEEERQAAESRASGFDIGASRSQSTVAQDEDDAMWDAFDNNVPHDAGPATTQMSGPAPDEDEDMWDVIREMEAADSEKGVAPSPLISGPQVAAGSQPEEGLKDPTAPSATNDEGWDDMYA